MTDTPVKEEKGEDKMVHLLENGDIRLVPKEMVNKTGPSGIKISAVILSRMGLTFRWITDILEGREDIKDEHEADEKKYKVIKTSNNIFLQEIRGNISNVAGFTSREIPLVLAELKKQLGKTRMTDTNCDI